MLFDVWAHEDKLVLEYSPDNPGWLERKLAEPGPVTLRRVFVVNAEDRIDYGTVEEWRPMDASSDHFYFVLGALAGEYFKIDGRKLGLRQAVSLDRHLRFSIRQFRAARGVSVFREIALLTRADIYIGGGAESAIPLAEFGKIVAALPTDSELRKYVAARISGIVRNYIDDAEDAVSVYIQHRNRGLGRRPTSVMGAVAAYEAEKYRLLLDHLTEMLNGEKQYLERDWQVEVKDIILLVYPQYLKAFREAPIRESGVKKPRSVDFLLTGTRTRGNSVKFTGENRA